MDAGRIKKLGKEYFLKYRWALLVLVIGLVLMLLPEGEDIQEVRHQTEESATLSDEEQLERILSKVQGVGAVDVMLTLETGSRNIYQTDTSDGIGWDTVIVNGNDRGQEGLVTNVEGPRYRGAVVVCQGGDDPRVKLAVVEAVCNATGLGADRVTVLKMK